MHEALSDLCDSLEDLADTLLNAWGENRTLKDVHGWHHPPLTRQDIAEIPISLINKLEKFDIDDIDKVIEDKIKLFPAKVEQLKRDTITYIFNGNAHQALPAYMATMNWINLILEPLFSWENLKDTKAMPHQMAKRLRTIKAEIDQLTPNKEEITNQIRLIQDATEAAESLPTDLQALIDARAKIERLSDDSVKFHSAIEQRNNSTNAYEQVITSRADAAEKLVMQCEEAYRITTTKGLAAGFDQRAGKLGASMWVWVVGLVLSLGIGAILGSKRISSLTESLSIPDPRWEIILAQLILSALSVGAPLWFAWVSTKQISQRFRLAEDYAFKASVAKAYEGYRKEAARIDEAFEARLFSSALTRLEEAPLRLVETDHHNSPWSELFSSPHFQKALDTIPELKDKFIEISKSGFESLMQDRRHPKSKDQSSTQAGE
ncbi:hypothetical protein F3I62_14505 [Pseudomonas sp. R-28-1W-6]|uniref:hypothetical protein n=1 Tax=Pseudomonas sp. R-28-1W-6 TaxID=2650101 RepID=UPI001365455E|nr:hypothetical protein [Pseudomonas sp. R-28-1W-6]MWV13314.1 hypothetical protein [Pseudomonas sp. R-28-1W-6]